MTASKPPVVVELAGWDGKQKLKIVFAERLERETGLEPRDPLLGKNDWDQAVVGVDAPDCYGARSPR